jgi:hypothetical protein
MSVGVLVGAPVAWLLNHKRAITSSALVISAFLLAGSAMLPMFYLIETAPGIPVEADIPEEYGWYVVGFCLAVIGATAHAIQRWGKDS